MPISLPLRKIQFMAINVDHNPCNLDGKNTVHYMGMIMVLTQFSNDTCLVSRNDVSNHKRKGLSSQMVKRLWKE